MEMEEKRDTILNKKQDSLVWEASSKGLAVQSIQLALELCWQRDRDLVFREILNL